MAAKGFEVVLPGRVVKNPTPEIAPGGDCGASVVAGITGLGVREVYDWNDRNGKAGTVEGLSWPGMRQVLYNLYGNHRIQHLMDSVPLFLDLRPASSWIFGNPGWVMARGWFHWVTLAVKAGYYALASVDSERRGPLEGKDGDHWVLLCGAREVWPEGCGTIAQEVLVSNSSRSQPDEEWVDVNTFLQRWGGYNVLLVKPWASGPPADAMGG